MKFLLVLLALSASTVLCAYNEDRLLSEWENFKTFHKETAYSSPEEEARRLEIFRLNYILIDKHNEEAEFGLHTYTLGINKFADLTSEEFNAIYNRLDIVINPLTEQMIGFEGDQSRAVPNSIDWRTTGHVTEVRDQGQCGSCWAFSAVGSIEGQHKEATGESLTLSEQHLVDCAGKAWGNNGCQGGLMTAAFKYVINNTGIYTLDSTPYQEIDTNECKQREPSKIGSRICGFKEVNKFIFGENDLKSAVGTVGPISVAIDASLPTFQLYKSGVYYDSNCKTIVLNHGVLAVGYGTENGQDYWLIKNSWSKGWGDNGYVKIARNKGNACGVSSRTSYAVPCS